MKRDPLIDSWQGPPVRVRHDDAHLGPYTPRGAVMRSALELASDVEGLRLVLATLRIIAVLQPAYWVIENPRGRLRSLDLLAGIPRRTVWYCRLGLDRAKPTDLWGVFPPGLELPAGCRNGNPDHTAAPRGSRTGTKGGVSTEEAGRIPRELANAFRVALEDAL